MGYVFSYEETKSPNIDWVWRSVRGAAVVMETRAQRAAVAATSMVDMGCGTAVKIGKKAQISKH